MLWLCAAISFSLDFVIGAFTEDSHTSWVRRLFAASDAELIIRNRANVFHRHQLLFLMQEVARFCPEIGDPPGAELPLRELGELFLMANDQLNTPIPEFSTSADSALQLILMLLPSNEANLLANAFQKMGRAHLIVTEIAEARRGGKNYFDIKALFGEATGISYHAFEALMVMVFTRLVNVQDVLKDANKFGIDQSYFAKRPLPKPEIERFFGLVSATPEQLRADLMAQNPRPNDFRVTRNKPIVKIGADIFHSTLISGLKSSIQQSIGAS